MTKKRRLSLMTVFLPRENLFFIEEWLCYHIAIGFDHFYLYNNAGSRYSDFGECLEVTRRNKRGEPIHRLLAEQPDDEVKLRLERILAPFEQKGYVTHLPWRPKDSEGQITFGQGAAFMDFIRRYSADTDWVSFTDLDEFLVPVAHHGMKELVLDLEGDGATYVTLPQKCFAPRFDSNGVPIKEVIGITQCSEGVTADFGIKSLIRADTLRVPWRKKNYSIHEPTTKGWKTKRVLRPDLVRFNHYKFNRWELDWVSKNRGWILELKSTDAGLLSRFSDRVNAVKRGLAC